MNFSLVICSRDCLAIGVESSPTYSDGEGLKTRRPIYNLHRKSEVNHRTGCMLAYADWISNY